MQNIRLFNGEALSVMDKLIEEGVVVDAIICDPPFGTTNCSWDSVIPLEDYIVVEVTKRKRTKTLNMTKDEYYTYCFENSIIDGKELWKKNHLKGLWYRLNKIVKPNGAIVIFGAEPFSSFLRLSNLKNYKYSWTYMKTTPTGHLNAKKQPLRVSEDICVFYKKTTHL